MVEGRTFDRKFIIHATCLGGMCCNSMIVLPGEMGTLTSASPWSRQHGTKPNIVSKFDDINTMYAVNHTSNKLICTSGRAGVVMIITPHIKAAGNGHKQTNVCDDYTLHASERTTFVFHTAIHEWLILSNQKQCLSNSL